MGRRISILLVILILQTISFVTPEARAQEKGLAQAKSKEEIQMMDGF